MVDLSSKFPRPRSVARIGIAYDAVPTSDGRKILLCGLREACVLDVATGRVLERYPEASAAWFVDGGRGVVTSYWDIRVYRRGHVERGFRNLTIQSKWLSGAVIKPDGRITAYVNGGEYSVVLDVHDPRSSRLGTEALGLDSQNPVRLSRGSGGSKLVDARTGRSLLAGPNVSLTNFAAVTTNRRTLVTALDERSAGVYNAMNSTPKAALPMKALPESAEFSKDEHLLALGDSRGNVAFFDTANWRPRAGVKAASAPVRVMGFSEDGRSLYVLDDQQVSLVDVEKGRLQARLIGNSEAVLCAAFHPDGTRIATGSGDGTVRMWDTRDGRELTILGRHPAGVFTLGSLDGGRSLVSVDANGGIRVWLTQREELKR